MAIQIDPGRGQATITFTIAGTEAEAVSVVGSFNDWTPGQHTFEPTHDGTLAVSVPVDAGREVHFRYLDSNGTWFDDPDSDAITEYGSLIAAVRLTVDGPATGDESEPNTRPDPDDATPSSVSASVPEPDAAAPASTKTRRTKKQSA